MAGKQKNSKRRNKMPFPKLNVRFRNAFGSCMRQTYIENKETGICIPTTEECNKKLPDSENFEIHNQMRAGVTLQDVNTKILNTNQEINIPEFEKAITKTINKKKTNTKKGV